MNAATWRCGRRVVTLVARNTGRVQISWAATLIRFAFLLVAALLAWRRPDDSAARALVVFLCCYGTAMAINNGVLPGNGGTAAAAVFAARFPSGTARPLPHALAVVAVAIAAASVLGIAIAELTAHTADTVSLTSLAFLAAFVALGLLVFVILAVAYVQGEAAERQPRKWVFLMLAVGLSGPVIDIIVTEIGGFNPLVDQLTLLPLGLLPAGLAYVILRHRVIDVGFVLNRAVVYTAVSILVVGVFVIVPPTSPIATRCSRAA